MKCFLISGVITFLLAAMPSGHSAESRRGDIQILISPSEIHQGDAVFVKVICSHPLKSIQGRFKGKDLIFFRGKGGLPFFSLLGVDLDQPPGKEELCLHITGEGGEVIERRFAFAVIKRDFPVQRLTLPPEMVTLSAENLSRVRKERTVVQTLFASITKKRQWERGFVMPVDGAVLSPFGVRRILNGEPRSPHTGVDLKAEMGTPVHATSSGTVALVGDHFFAGKSVYIDHGMGIVSMYFHLSSVLVKEGERVHMGQVIGLVGQSGRATGPHLHWGIRIQGSRVDPLTLVRLFPR